METSSYFCTSEWHFAEFKGKGAYYAPLIFGFALRMAKTSGKFYCSIPRLQVYFRLDERTVRAALHLLVATGFFQMLSDESGKAITYKPIKHQEWAKLHPGRCPEKIEMPSWFGDQDPLGRALFAASSGNVTFYPNFIKGMRKTGHSDQSILGHWSAFLLVDKPTGKQWKQGIVGRFMKHLRAQPVGTNNPSHPMYLDPSHPMQGEPLPSDGTSRVQ